MRDQANNIAARAAILPAVLKADPVAITIDRAGFDAVTFVLQVGVGGITFTDANRIDFYLEHSDDGTNWAGVLADMTIGGNIDQNVAGANGGDPGWGRVLALKAAHPDPTVHRYGYIDGRYGEARYVRLRPAFIGAHGTGTPMSALAILGNPREQPVAA